MFVDGCCGQAATSTWPALRGMMLMKALELAAKLILGRGSSKLSELPWVRLNITSIGLESSESTLNRLHDQAVFKLKCTDLLYRVKEELF